MISIAPLDGAKTTCVAECAVSSHPQIEALVIHAIADAVAEWRRHLLRGSRSPLDCGSVAARNLIAAFDFFLSYGFNRGNRLYWLFVKEFMSRSEVDYLRREWHATSTRQLSVSWLKDALNKQTLPFHFQSFQHDMELIRKFYRKEASMSNYTLLSRIVQQVLDLSDVQFQFLKPFEKQNKVPLAVMRSTLVEQGPSTSNDRSLLLIRPSHEERKYLPSRQRSGTELSVHSQDLPCVLLSTPIPPDFVETHPVALDQDGVEAGNNSDGIFDEILRRRRSGSHLPNNWNCLQAKDEEESKAALSVDKDMQKLDIKIVTSFVPVDPFDMALKTSLSKVKLSVADEQQNEREYRASPVPTLADLPCGELRLNMGEVIGLTINIFKHDTERFMRLFQVYSHFGTGEAEKRMLALSNQAAYLLSVENVVTPRSSYITRAYLPLRYIDCVEVGPDFQVVYLCAKKDYNVCEEKADKFSSVIEICAACMQLGAVIVDALKYAYENYVSSSQPENPKLEVYSDSTSQHLILRRFMSKELHEDNPTLFGYYLAQWRQTNLYNTSGEGYQHSGFLYHKEVRGGVSWLLGSSDFQHSYFHLQNKKLYQFSDSTCKFGERVISVRDSVSDVTELKGGERSPHMFEIVVDNSTRIQFICQSAADMHKWVSLITLAITSTDMNDELVACVVCLCERSILVAQEGLNCATDGFMRLLVRIDLACVSQATGVFAAERSACVIRNGQKLDWLFLRSPDEVDRLLGQLSQLGMRQINSEEGGSSRLSAILNSMPRDCDIFQFTNILSDDAFETSLEL